MKDYTIEEVVQSLLKINKKSRKRVLVDQRSYLIGILIHKFRITEHKVAKLTGYNRHTIHYNKKLPLNLYNDPTYESNVYVLATQYPFDFAQYSETVEEEDKTKRSVNVSLVIDRQTYKRLKAAGWLRGHKDVRTTIKELIDKTLQVWDE
jgi:hypothetical protein